MLTSIRKVTLNGLFLFGSNFKQSERRMRGRKIHVEMFPFQANFVDFYLIYHNMYQHQRTGIVVCFFLRQRSFQIGLNSFFIVCPHSAFIFVNDMLGPFVPHATMFAKGFF